MEMSTTRRRFLQFASGGVLGTAVAGTTAGAGPQATDRRYWRPCSPNVEVHYPRSWHLETTVLTDLVGPTELFYVSSRPIRGHASVGESGVPDMTLFPPDTVLIRLIGYPEDEAEHHGWSNGRRPASDGVRFDDLAEGDSWPPGFVHRSQWYAGPAFGYTVGLWAGTAGADMETARAVVDSIKLP
jgi:hypothetical protein